MRNAIALVFALALVLFAARESRRAERSALSAVSAARPRQAITLRRPGPPRDRSIGRIGGP